jgi:hypothetical protein
MARTFAWRSLGAALLAAAAGCGTEITTAGHCPELCPAGGIQLADTLLTSPVVSDTSVRGYVLVREAAYLLLSDLDSLKSEVLLQYGALPTVWTVGTDSVSLGAVDSVKLLLTVLQRDTAAKALRIVLHRLPAQFDTGTTYDGIAPYFADSTLWDTSAVGEFPDTLVSGGVTLAAPDTLRALPGDTGVVSLGLSLVSPAPTALAAETGSVVLEYFVRGHLTKDTLQRDTLPRTLSLVPTFSTFVMSPDPGQPASGVLAVGGIPTARATMRLDLPKEVVDSNAIVRGTLILTTLDSVGGFARDSFRLAAQPILRDYGPKSLLYPDSSVAGTTWLHPGQTGQVQVDITRLLRLWGTVTGDTLPRAVVLRVIPEGGLLSAASFAGLASGAGAPQLRVTYVRRFTFGVP